MKNTKSPARCCLTVLGAFSVALTGACAAHDVHGSPHDASGAENQLVGVTCLTDRQEASRCLAEARQECKGTPHLAGVIAQTEVPNPVGTEQRRNSRWQYQVRYRCE